jgi:cation diffusion facilitator CzcD-associated flavoprotein CzcO
VNSEIGTGASAVQLIPELAKQVADLTVYQRTAIHTVPKIDFAIPAVMQRLFARLPLAQRVFRALTDTFFELITVTAVYYRQFRRLRVDGGDLAMISRFLSIRDAGLRRKLTPDYDFGCKRPTWSNHYYSVFTKPHVHLRTGSSGSNRTVSSPPTATRTSSTPWCWPRVSTCGTPIFRPSR